MNVFDFWQNEDSTIAPLSEKQLLFIEKLESQSNARFASSSHVTQETSDDSNTEFETLEKFEEWFDNSLHCFESDQNVKYQKLIDYCNECKAILSVIDETLQNLETLDKQYEYSSNKTNSLHNICENILHQQHGLIMAMDAINEKLVYFKEYEHMTKKFSSSSVLILNESLMTTLKRLDECIDFFEKKSNYLESSVYLKNFKHLQSQALSTIKNHVISSIQRSAKQVAPESTEAIAPGDSVFTLFYGKFQAGAARIKSLMTMIEERQNKDETYKKYLRECHDTYFKARELLISPVLSVAINDMVSSHQRSYCSLTRNSSKMLMHICRDEHQLFFQFFTQQSEALDEFLEKLCLNLYDVLRSVVIHIEHLEILSELCIILKYEVIEDVLESSELQSFAHVMSQLLEDTQERLVYRTNIYLQTSIIGYSPAPGDLAYPEKLEMMESIAEYLITSNSSLSRSGSVCSIASASLSDVSLVTNDRSDFSSKFSSSPADIHGMWYPTVRRAIMCLTKLYRSLDKEAFQGLAQEVISGCLDSLEVAKEQISKNKSQTDGCLFFIKHLLVIREQISPFKIECSYREVALDFTRVKSAALNILQNRENIFSLTNNNSLLQFLFEVPGAPQVIDQIIDPQRIVDSKIKTACEQFIAMSADSMLSPLLRFNSLVNSCSKTENICNQHFATAESISKMVKELHACFTEKLSFCRKMMSLYLANSDTENILFKPIRANVVGKIDSFMKFLEMNYKSEDNEKIGIGQLLEMKQAINDV
ncbi:conserved oligomeric Golgi complex subunit 3-like protein [Dinothrombium tinctorium]|uniref:Conserved oligomeric Golgi complex subunit 3 n=1 Tax=Dinothrombium tinctorium TaxID=1965070 RepID=A0A3S3P9T7_9ACAR|nr:conserved oligomeric Golgi complex subunit 3-like protein [Dinothrombium tinctorium]RWS10936.1 conserved oligomeric Golgi complex subunit 3-like protein [Dinothrombium tinctorium]RWS10937.1 conserved oligomeric Golgi complex subunit 3-like protein [Dinothrombium tinctorium]